MTASIIDTLARDTGVSQGRRNALKVFGLAAIAAMGTSTLATEAKNKNKNKRKKRRNRQCLTEDCTTEARQAATAACQAQVALCEQEVRVICGRSEPDGEKRCLSEALPCCAPLGTCDVAAFFACLVPPPDPND